MINEPDIKRGILYKAKVYLCCQLQFGDFDEVRRDHDYFKEQTKGIGLTVLSPLDRMFLSFEMESKELHFELKERLKNGDFDYVHEQAQLIRNRDLNACDLSTFIVAKLDPNVPAFGLTDEVITSKRNGRPVFLIISGGFANCPIWLCSYFKPSWVYNDYDSVIKKLVEINEGKQEINPKTWKILSEQYR